MLLYVWGFRPSYTLCKAWPEHIWTCLVTNPILLFWLIPIFDHAESITGFIFPVFRGTKVVVLFLFTHGKRKLIGTWFKLPKGHQFCQLNVRRNLIYSGYFWFCFSSWEVYISFSIFKACLPAKWITRESAESFCKSIKKIKSMQLGAHQWDSGSWMICPAFIPVGGEQQL